MFQGNDIPSRQLIDTCVHCGFCLPTCPTYLLWGEEMDSPRGRIYLMKAGLEGRAEMTPSYVRHFDACLGCLACVTACPSGVQYAPLIEKTRAQIERHHERGVLDRLFRTVILSLVPYPGRMRIALAPLLLVGGLVRAIGRLMSPAPRAAAAPAPETRPAPHAAGETPSQGGFLRRVGAALALAPRVSLHSLTSRLPHYTAPPKVAARLKVGLLSGCIQRLVFTGVNEATIRVLTAEGCSVTVPPDQGCCGALSLHSGDVDQARRFARRNIEVLDAIGLDRIVVNAAGCGSAMKEYGELFANDRAWAARARTFSARVRDVSELLAELGPPRAPRQPVTASAPVRVVYHDACHLAHGQGVRAQPRALLQAIPGIELFTPAEADICCGSAGIFNLVQPEPAAQLGARKAAHIAALSPDMIATANPGCILQIAAAARGFGYNWPIFHPIELIDASIRGVDPRKHS